MKTFDPDVNPEVRLVLLTALAELKERRELILEMTFLTEDDRETIAVMHSAEAKCIAGLAAKFGVKEVSDEAWALVDGWSYLP